jgi:membrane protein
MEVARYARGFLELLREAWTEYERDHARYLAGAMVYYTLVSLIPLLLLLLSALGLLLRFSGHAAALQQEVLGTVEITFGPQLRAALEELLTTLQRQSITATVVSLIGLWLAASVLFRHLRLTFRAIWKYAPPLISGPILVAMRASFVEKVVGYVLVLLSGGLVLAAIGLIGVARWLHSLLESLPLIGPGGGWLITALSPFTIAATVFAFLFRFVPPVRIPWRVAGAAAALCALGWIAASAALSLYGNYFGSHLSTYGAMGALLAVMLWMKLVSQIVYFGAELCKVTVARAG